MWPQAQKQMDLALENLIKCFYEKILLSLNETEP